VRPQRATALRAWHPRVSAPPAMPPVSLTQVGERDGQGESAEPTNRDTTGAYQLTPKLLYFKGTTTDGSEKPKLASNTARLRQGASQLQASFLCYALVRGIGQRCPELVIRKGGAAQGLGSPWRAAKAACAQAAERERKTKRERASEESCTPASS
jgi:hypothetical protein